MKKLTRRKFIKKAAAGGCLAAASGMIPGFALRSAQAVSPNAKYLIFIQLRGGHDGLTMFAPTTANFTLNLRLSIKRPNIFLDDTDILAFGSSGWGVNSRLPVFWTANSNNNFSVITGVGVNNMICNPDLAEQIMGAGIADANSPATSGWIQRMMQIHQIADPMAVLDFFGGTFATTAGGTYRPWAYRSFYNARTVRGSVILNSESSFPVDMLAQAAKQKHAYKKAEEITANDQLADYGTYFDDLNDAFNTQPGGYGGTPFEQRIRQVDGLMRDLEAEDRPTIALVPYEGWDTPFNQIPTMNTLMTDLNDAITTLRTNLMGAGLWNQTAVFIYGDYGRRIDENEAQGTDRSPTQMMFGVGGAVRGGIFGGYPTREEVDADIGVLTQRYNWLDVLHSVGTGAGYNMNAVLPGHTPAGLSLIT